MYRESLLEYFKWILGQESIAVVSEHKRSFIMAGRMRSNLAEQLKKVDPSDLLEIILELYPPAEPASMRTMEMQSRSEKIAAKKEAFSRNVATVEDAIRKVGGEITGLAWINQTVRARVPAQGVKELSQHEKVVAIDIPHLVKPDIG
jgi:hypothetical protein